MTTTNTLSKFVADSGNEKIGGSQRGRLTGRR